MKAVGVRITCPLAIFSAPFMTIAGSFFDNASLDNN
jgi:hypothetical protein